MIGLAALLVLMYFTAGCTVGPDFVNPDHSALIREKWVMVPDDGEIFTDTRPPDSVWWQQFNDDELTGLIDRLRAVNPVLSQARERIVEAMARQGVVAADRRLQLAADLGYNRAETGSEAVSMQRLPPGRTLDVYSTGLTAGWEIDLWGRVARLLEAGEQDIGASYADYQGMAVSLAAELSLNYVEMRSLEARIATTQKNIELQRKTLKLARSSFAAGNGTELAVVRTERQLSSMRSHLPEHERNLTAAKNRINALLGLPPGEIVFAPGSLPKIPEMLGVGLPADLVTRRPDVRFALHRYHAAVARIGAAEAQRYPALSIAGTLTLSSDTPAGFFDADSFIYTLGPGLRFPLLTGNRLESDVAVRKSQAEQARLGLEQQIVTALAEVETAAIGVVRTQERLVELDNTKKSADRSVELATDLYRSGLGDLFEVLDNQQQLVAIEEEQLVVRQQALIQIVSLYRALGGGWQSVMQEQPVQNQEN